MGGGAVGQARKGLWSRYAFFFIQMIDRGVLPLEQQLDEQLAGGANSSLHRCGYLFYSFFFMTGVITCHNPLSSLFYSRSLRSLQDFYKRVFLLGLCS